MATSDIEKVMTFFQGIEAGDAELATKYLNPDKYIEHNPRSADGVDGFRGYIRLLTKENHRLKVGKGKDVGEIVTLVFMFLPCCCKHSQDKPPESYMLRTV